jgi:hypothetical protein
MYRPNGIVRVAAAAAAVRLAAISVTAVALDGGQPVSYTASSLPGGLSISPSISPSAGVISGTLTGTAATSPH